MVCCPRDWFFYQKLDQFGKESQRNANGGHSSGSGRGPDRFIEWFKGLSFSDAVCWAFEITPAAIPVIYWSHTLEEIQQYVRLKLSWWQTRASQDYQVMAIIMQQAFGSSETNKGSEPTSKEEAEMMLAGIFKPK